MCLLGFLPLSMERVSLSMLYNAIGPSGCCK
jgi:hypothetical protein